MIWRDVYILVGEFVTAEEPVTTVPALRGALPTSLRLSAPSPHKITPFYHIKITLIFNKNRTMSASILWLICKIQGLNLTKIEINFFTF